MAALTVPGVSGLPDDALPFRRLGATSSGTSYACTVTDTSRNNIILGCDLTATQANPVNVFANLQLNGVILYWDNQQTGAGNGITFAWRGQLPLGLGDTFGWHASSDNTIIWGAVLWGYSFGRQTNFF